MFLIYNSNNPVFHHIERETSIELGTAKMKTLNFYAAEEISVLDVMY